MMPQHFLAKFRADFDARYGIDYEESRQTITSWLCCATTTEAVEGEMAFRLQPAHSAAASWVY